MFSASITVLSIQIEGFISKCKRKEGMEGGREKRREGEKERGREGGEGE